MVKVRIKMKVKSRVKVKWYARNVHMQTFRVQGSTSS